MPGYNLKEYLSLTPSKDKWGRIGARRRAGVAVPLFSVYSRNSLGAGDFSDLKLLIDWAKVSGLSIIQFLPLNEVEGVFCPYDALSSFALEPLYISLDLIPAAKKKNFRVQVGNARKKFPTGRERIDYGVKKEKIQILKSIFLEEEGGNYLRESKDFINENTYWLKDFALFKVLKDYHGLRPWYEWEDKYKNRDPKALDSFGKEQEKEIAFQVWLQWQLYKQLKEARNYARAKGVLLKGDLPLLVSRDSADVWTHSEFFKLEYAAGAPPDTYCAKGQRWGMPVYDWDKIVKDGYQYLKEKLKYAQNFYDILRIDHVVGLFRLWSIPYAEPLDNAGLNGFFDLKDESKQEARGRNILSVILKNTSMLICAEDLGSIPKICPKVLGEFGIPGNDVQRWVKDWRKRHDFLAPQDYRLLSVAMLSTHDTTNWPAWWEYEAGTIDEKLFVRKCCQRGIDYNSVKEKLFDLTLSRYGRLHWRKDINSVGILIDVLGRKKEDIADFIEIYENSYLEKEKLWRQLGLAGQFQEESGRDIVCAALGLTLESKAIFCIEVIVDWLYLGGLFKGDPSWYRINIPGKIDTNNWSLALPICLEDLIRHPVCSEIKEIVKKSGRI